MFADLRREMLALGADTVGCADISGLPGEQTQGFPRAIVALVGLDRDIVSRIPQGPRQEYFDLYNDTNRLLDGIGLYAQGYLTGKGFGAFAVTRDRARQDAETLLTPYPPHKTLATLAGLGWVGKSALLINRDFGAALRMTAVLTDAPLPVGQPVRESSCGACTACVDACPGGAIQGSRWTPGTQRTELVDVDACQAAMRERCRDHPTIQALCGVCIEACPHTRGYLHGS